jgi:hypothetical protein
VSLAVRKQAEEFNVFDRQRFVMVLSELTK